MTIGFIIKFIGTIMDLCLPWIPAYMIDTVIPQGTHKEPMEKKGFCHRLYKAQFE